MMCVGDRKKVLFFCVCDFEKPKKTCAKKSLAMAMDSWPFSCRTYVWIV